MPCRDYYSYENEAKAQRRIDKLTRMLCKMCEHIEAYSSVKDPIFRKGVIRILSPETHVWWEAHKKKDVKRKVDKTKA